MALDHPKPEVAAKVGGPQFPALLDCIRPRGRYGVSGAIAGPIVELDLRTLYLKDLRLIGCTIPEADVFPRLVQIIENGEIKPIIEIDRRPVGAGQVGEVSGRLVELYQNVVRGRMPAYRDWCTPVYAK